MDYPEPADGGECSRASPQLDEAGLGAFIAERGLAMDLADILFCQRYFAEEGRQPTITEIKMIDTYWSDHCRHTTFGTVLDDVSIADKNVQLAFEKYLDMRHELGRDEKPVCLMDMGTIGAKWLRAQGILTNLDESEEINACTVKVKVDVDGQEAGLAVPVQERDPQPSHRDRALRRGGHLRGRRHPRPLVGPQLRVPGHAPDRRGRSHGAGVQDHSGQAAPAQAGHHGGGRLFLLRQPDRPGHGPGERAVPSRLRRQAHGDRRRGGRHAGRPRAPRDAGAGRRGGASGRTHRPRRHRRRHGVVEGP